MNKHIQNILKMRTSLVTNYGIPGVDSSLITKGIVRIFESSREQQDAITPHSHKFDFSCLVLSGMVTNRIWTKDKNGDEFTVSESIYQGEIGKYQHNEVGTDRFSFVDTEYFTGDWYSMDSHEIHSIWFSKGCKVLFFEGEVLTQKTTILEPFVREKTIKTFEVKPWMFKSEQLS